MRCTFSQEGPEAECAQGWIFPCRMLPSDGGGEEAAASFWLTQYRDDPSPLSENETVWPWRSRALLSPVQSCLGGKVWQTWIILEQIFSGEEWMNVNRLGRTVKHGGMEKLRPSWPWWAFLNVSTTTELWGAFQHLAIATVLDVAF